MRVIKIFFIIIFCVSFKINAQNHYVVTLNNDTANPFNATVGTLRWAIEQANQTAGLDYIDFNIALTPPVVIQLNSNLPPITDRVIIDGNTQPNYSYSGNDPKIAIKGDVTPGNIFYVFCLYKNQPWETTIADASLSEIKNLKIYESDYNSILLSRVTQIKILNNVIHSSNGYGIRFSGASKCVVKGNYFGTDKTLTQNNSYALQAGNLINFDTYFPGDSNIIGGLTSGDANYFYNSNQLGTVWLGALAITNSNYNKISGNVFINNSKNINLFDGKSCSGNICHQPPVFQGIYVSGNTTVSGTASGGDVIEVFKTNATNIDAVQYIGTAVTNASGNWSFTTTNLNLGDVLIATATDSLGNTSEFSSGNIVEPPQPCCLSLSLSIRKGGDGPLPYICPGDSFKIYVYSNCQNLNYSWDFGDGTTLTSTGYIFSVKHLFNTSGIHTVTLTASSADNSCVPTTATLNINVNNCQSPCLPQLYEANIPREWCINQQICYASQIRVCDPNSPNFTWNFGDGTPPIQNCGWCHTYTATGTYTVSMAVSGASCITSTLNAVVNVSDCPPPPPCEDCIGSFSPIPTHTYIVSAWVKEGGASPTKTSYTFPSLVVACPSASFVSTNFVPTGVIIDGWQRIEGEFIIPYSANDISINLNCSSPTGDCYFDDVRVFPVDGSMKSYVYDPVSMRLVAELDERNFATIYEYDEEGKLVRVKKETERGIMTIKENRNSSSK